jgi:RasGEF domain
MIHWSNHVGSWVASEIVQPAVLRQRQNALRAIVDMAEALRGLNNFNALMEILSALQSSSVHRMKQTWAGLSTSQKRVYDEVCKLMNPNPNFLMLRNHIKTVNPPCIPYLGVYLTGTHYEALVWSKMSKWVTKDTAMWEVHTI